MKLTSCDVCGKIIRNGVEWTVEFKSGSDVLLLNGDDVHEVGDRSKDVCAECVVKLFNMMFPNRTFMTIEEYKTKIEGEKQ